MLARMMTTTHICRGIMAIARVPRRSRRGTRTVLAEAGAGVAEVGAGRRSLGSGARVVVGCVTPGRGSGRCRLESFPGVVVLLAGSGTGVG